MKCGKGLRGLSPRHEDALLREKSRRAKSRWWRAVSQRVPRDAYRRIAKIDAFGVYPASREKRCRVDRPNRFFVNLMAIEKPWD
jgi:hypothetical protein